MRSPSVTTMKRTSFSGQLESSLLSRPRAVIGKYMPRAWRKMWANFWHVSPTVGVYTSGMYVAGSDIRTA